MQQRSKHCLFVTNSDKNCHCSVCGSFCTETETEEQTDRAASEVNEDPEMCNGIRPKRKTISALKRLQSLQLPVSISIIEKTCQPETDTKFSRPETRIKSEPICQLFEPEVRIKSEDGFFERVSTRQQNSDNQEDQFDPSGWSDEFTGEIKKRSDIIPSHHSQRGFDI